MGPTSINPGGAGVNVDGLNFWVVFIEAVVYNTSFTPEPSPKDRQETELRMPFCSKCRNEYIDGTEVCEDCGVKLVVELPAESSGGADTELVEVWHAQGEMEAQLTRSLLESHGISSMITGESLRLTHGFTIDGLAEAKILVREEDAKRAKEVIALQEGMTQCEQCGYPAREIDGECARCGGELRKK